MKVIREGYDLVCNCCNDKLLDQKGPLKPYFEKGDIHLCNDCSKHVLQKLIDEETINPENLEQAIRHTKEWIIVQRNIIYT